MGMSFGSMVSSFGTDAYGVNPANFDLHRKFKIDTTNLKLRYKSTNSYFPKYELAIANIGGGYGSDTTMSFYNNYIKYLSINRNTFTSLFTNIFSVLQFRDSILPGSNTNVNYDFELKWFSLSYSDPKRGTINFTIADRVGLNTNAYSRDIEMPLNFQYYMDSTRTKSYLTNVNLYQAEATAWWIRKYSVSYAKNLEINKSLIKNFAFGVSLGLVHGFGDVTTYKTSLNLNSYGIKNINGSNHVDSISGKQDFHTLSALTDMFQDYRDGAKSHYEMFPKPAGKGYSIDLGVNAQLGNKIRIALSVTDIGKITWNYNTILNNDTNSFIYRNFFLNSSDLTYNRFVDDLDGLDSRITGVTYSTNMPTKYRAGIMYQPSDKLLAEFDWIKGDNNSPGNTTKSLFALGGEYYPLNYLPCRVGFSIGGYDNWAISAGAGLRFKYLIIDFGAEGINNAIANKRLTLAFSTKFLL